MSDIPVPSSPTIGPLSDGSSTDANSTNEELRKEIDHMRRMASTQPVIEQAKGVLMHRYHIDARMAFELLSRWSRALEQRVSVIAEVLLELAEVAETQTPNPILVASLRGQMGGEWKPPT